MISSQIYPEFLSYLLLVSNGATPEWAKTAIQVSMWLAVLSQIFLLVPDLLFTIKTRDTRENKWFKWIVWFVCSACWIAYSIFLTWETIPLEEVIGLAISEGANLICLFIIYSIKINNIRLAKKFDLTEKQWCALQNSIHLAKKTLSKPTRKKLKRACKRLTVQEKARLYIDAMKKYNVAKSVRRNVKKNAKKVARSVIKRAKKKKS